MSVKSGRLRVLLAGGGSAGHVNPLLAVAQKLQDFQVECVALGTASGLEKELVPAAGFQLEVIEKVPAPRRLNADLWKFLPRLWNAYAQTSRVLKNGGFDAVVGFGGYVSAPAYLAAKRLGIPVIVHEQNLRPGMANKLGAQWAKLVALSFADTPLQARSGQTLHVGLPLRPEIERLAKELSDPQRKRQLRRQTAQKYGFDAEKPTLLVTGGSLGALKLNRVLAESAALFPVDMQIIHLTGKGKAAEVKQSLAAANVKANWQVFDYFVDMSDAFTLADFVVCRSGAGTVAELSALGLPALYVPLPIGNGEQKLNAAGVVANGGALLVEDTEFSVETVRQTLLPLLKDVNRLAEMRQRSLELGQVAAAQSLAQKILEVIGA